MFLKFFSFSIETDTLLFLIWSDSVAKGYYDNISYIEFTYESKIWEYRNELMKWPLPRRSLEF